MVIKIPNETKKFSQVGTSNVLGNIWSSMNLNLTENIGRIRVSGRGMLVDGSAVNIANIETPVAFTFFDDGNERIWAIGGARMFHNTGDPDDTFTQDATASTPTDLDDGSDLELFNEAMYVANASGDLYKKSGSWSLVTSQLNGGNVSMCRFGARLYGTQSTCQIWSIDADDVLVEPDSPPNLYSLDLEEFGGGFSDNNEITWIRAASDRIWIGTRNTGNASARAPGCRGRVYEWDGVSTEPTRHYELESLGTLAGVIKDDIPYIMDADGKLLAFNQSSFVEVARLPVPHAQYLRNPANSSTVQRFIHPRGIAIRNGRITMLISNVNNVTSQPIENLPSGLWEYDPDIGLYHRQSISLWNASTTSTRTDFSQNRVAQVGAIYPCKSTSGTDNDGDVMMGVQYYTSATASAYGIFTTNSLDTKPKMGYLVTTWIESQSVQDTWQKIYAIHKRLLDSSDRISVKFRTYESTPIEGAITWTSTTTFTSTADLSTVEVGDEVEIMRGTGGGQCEHISDIQFATGTYTVTVDTAYTGASGTATARFQKWKKAGDLNTQGLDVQEAPIGEDSPAIQIKIVMYFTGNNEINQLKLINTEKQPSE